jgi:hypothetical protein
MEVSSEQLRRWLDAIDNVDAILIVGKVTLMKGANRADQDEVRTQIRELERAYDEIETAYLDSIREDTTRKTA